MSLSLELAVRSKVAVGGVRLEVDACARAGVVGAAAEGAEVSVGADGSEVSTLTVVWMEVVLPTLSVPVRV